MVRYAEEFKREAARLVIEEGYSRNAAAKAVGVASQSISAWVEEFTERINDDRVYRSEKEELEALRAENRTLRMEREILKKATALFAAENRR